jgi:protein-S-isoprenylcysteine O-methyltransferase Ste14
VPEISRQTVRLLLLSAFLFALPLFHLGVPFLLAHVGPRWGWKGDHPGPINFLGAVPILAGAVLLAWTLATMLVAVRSLPPRVRLGLRPAQLIESGPYAWMRHPMYVGESCFWLGVIILFGSPVVAAVFICLAGIAVVFMIRKEERALEEQFGEEYTTYRNHVPPMPPTLKFWRRR